MSKTTACQSCVLESTSGTPALNYSGGHTINSDIGRVLAVPHLFIHSFLFMHLFIHSLMHSFEYLLPTCQTGIYEHEYWLQKDTVKSKNRDMVQNQPERTCQPSEPWTVATLDSLGWELGAQYGLVP